MGLQFAVTIDISIREVEMLSTRDWSELPQEILEQIAEELCSCEDCIRFRGVCRSWRAIVVGRRNYTFFSKMLPWLVLPQQKDESGNDEDDISTFDLSTRSFFSLSERKVHPLNLPEALDCSDCWGSPYGWVFTLRNSEVSIVNLISNVRIHLPPLTSFDHYFQYPSSYFVRKLLLTISPSSSSTSLLPLQDQFLAFLIFRSYCNFFAFWRPGDKSWTTIETPSTMNEDILQIDNKFYVVDNEGEVRRFDMSKGDRVVQDFASPPEEIEGTTPRFYLVEMWGDLHMVVRFVDLENRHLGYYDPKTDKPFKDRPDGHTRSFEIFRLDLCTREWEEVYNIGDYAIFVGNNTSFSLLVFENSGWMCNAIYFTDDYVFDLMESCLFGETLATTSRGLDMGVYNLENDEFEPIFNIEDDGAVFVPAFWITPTLC